MEFDIRQVEQGYSNHARFQEQDLILITLTKSSIDQSVLLAITSSPEKI